MQLRRALIVATLAFSLIVTPQLALASEGGGAKKTEGPLYVDFKSIVVPVIKRNGNTGVVALALMVQVKDEKAKDKVTGHMPRLRDAFIRSLYGNLESNDLLREDGALDIEHIKARLMRTAQLVMKDKDNPIKDLLFQNISQQTY